MTARAKATAHAAYVRQKSENIQAIISEYKTRRKMTNDDIAKAVGLPVSTFKNRKTDPGRMRMEDIWMIFDVLDVPTDVRETVV